MKPKRNRVDVAAVTHLYTVAHLTLREIAKLTGVTHAGVAKALHRAGVTSQDGEHVAVRCSQCNEPYSILRARWRRNIRNFCTWECRRLSMLNPDLKLSRTGCQKARDLVSSYFRLRARHVVHHHDSDEGNNDIRNLAVFLSCSDHTSYERGGYALPIWDGHKLKDLTPPARPDYWDEILGCLITPKPFRTRYNASQRLG